MCVCVYIYIYIYIYIYKPTVTQTESHNKETYIGLTENTFKTRYNLHKSSLKLEHKKSATGLSENI